LERKAVFGTVLFLLILSMAASFVKECLAYSSPYVGLSISVIDSSFNSISGATVVSTSVPPGQSALRGTTNEEGYAKWYDILPGSYAFEVYKDGYEPGRMLATIQETQIVHIFLGKENSIDWQKNYGGTGDDALFSIQKPADGGYIAVGGTSSSGEGGLDVYVIRIDSDGNKLWQKTYGGAKDDWGVFIRCTSDNGSIIVGYTESFGAGASDVFLLKIDAEGNKQWQKTFGGTKDDLGWSVELASDGGYVLVGETYSYGEGGMDVYLIKTDSNGNKLWERTYGGAEDDSGKSITKTSGDGYVIVGWTMSFGEGSNDVFLIRIDSEGNELWHRTYGGYDGDLGASIKKTSDGGYIIAGTTYSFGAGEIDAFLVKVDGEGNKQWQKTFGDKGDDGFEDAQQTSDGGYILAGLTDWFGGEESSDIYLVKTDSDGNAQWVKRYGGEKEDNGRGGVLQTSDGGYLVAGYTYSLGEGGDAYLLHVTPPPPTGSISINNGATYTNTTSVILTLSATDVTSGIAEMRFSNDNSTWSEWETYSTSKTWALTTGDGTKSVTVQYKTKADLILAYSDSIILDATSPTANAGQDQTVNVGTTVSFDATASGDNFGIVSYEWNFDDGTSGTGNTTTHTYAKPNTYTVTLTVKDAAGNTATDVIMVTVVSVGVPLLLIVGGVMVIILIVAIVAILLWKKRK